MYVLLKVFLLMVLTLLIKFTGPYFAVAMQSFYLRYTIKIAHSNRKVITFF